jgi:hypothetical protein
MEEMPLGNTVLTLDGKQTDFCYYIFFCLKTSIMAIDIGFLFVV